LTTPNVETALGCELGQSLGREVGPELLGRQKHGVKNSYLGKRFLEAVEKNSSSRLHAPVSRTMYITFDHSDLGPCLCLWAAGGCKDDRFSFVLGKEAKTHLDHSH
jgi:hypothetical protein